MNRIKPIFIIFPVLFILMSMSCIAQIDSFNASFYMTPDRVVVKEKMFFKAPQTKAMEFDIPADAKGLSVDVDGKVMLPDITKTDLGQIFNLDLKSAKAIQVSYVTGEFIDGTDFIATFKAPDSIDELYVELTLPENAVLEVPLSQSTFSPSSAYPAPLGATTDGRSITLNWRYQGIEKDESKSFFVRYVFQGRNFYVFIASFLGMMLVFGLVYLLFMRKRISRVKLDETQEVISQSLEQSSEEDGFEKHLKEDEEQVVNILKQREGQCEQGTLRVITAFSKAKLSVLLKELEDRKIVYKEKRGKKNLVFLRKQ